ncbi:MAG: riboflavin synthase [Mariprofundales bacterium]
MFTGIIQDVGVVQACTAIEAGGSSLSISTALDSSAWKLGDSVAVNGCCLTVVGLHPQGRFSAELSQETLNITNLGSLSAGDAVNLEPALRAADPLGGHMVSGHVDGTAAVVSVSDRGDFREITFVIPTALAPYVVSKGSVALDGVSLTVNCVTDTSFSVCLIPHTLQQTNLNRLQPTSFVNLETDMVGRYIARQLHFLHAAEPATQGAEHAGKL